MDIPNNQSSYFITWRFSYPKHPDVISAIIKEKCGSEISHVDVKVPGNLATLFNKSTKNISWTPFIPFTPDGNAKWLGAHADTGVQIRDENYLECSVQLLYTLEVSYQQYKDFWSYVLGRVGDQYDQIGIAGIVLNRALKEAGHEFCSELQSEAIAEAEIFKIRKESCMLDPEQLRLIIASPMNCKEERIAG